MRELGATCIFSAFTVGDTSPVITLWRTAVFIFSLRVVCCSVCTFGEYSCRANLSEAEFLTGEARSWRLILLMTSEPVWGERSWLMKLRKDCCLVTLLNSALALIA